MEKVIVAFLFFMSSPTLACIGRGDIKHKSLNRPRAKCGGSKMKQLSSSGTGESLTPSNRNDEKLGKTGYIPPTVNNQCNTQELKTCKFKVENNVSLQAACGYLIVDFYGSYPSKSSLDLGKLIKEGGGIITSSAFIHEELRAMHVCYNDLGPEKLTLKKKELEKLPIIRGIHYNLLSTFHEALGLDEKQRDLRDKGNQ